MEALNISLYTTDEKICLIRLWETKYFLKFALADFSFFHYHLIHRSLLTQRA